MIEINGKEYDLKFGLGRIEMIENATGVPVMSEIYKNNGMLSIANLKTYFAFALKETGSDHYEKFKVGQDVAQSLIEERGYMYVNATVVNALERDCPFFFQEG